MRPFPGPGGKWQVSTGGGMMPTWSRTQPEIIFGAEGQLMVSRYSVANGQFHAAPPAQWSAGRFEWRGPNRMFDLHADGARVALAAPSGARAPTPDRVALIFNFFDELRRRLPVP